MLSFFYFNKKLRKSYFCKRHSRSLPSTHTKFARSCTISWIDISFSNVSQFWCICCLMLDDHVILHMHLLTCAIACFGLVFTVFWSRRSILFQKRNSASYHTPLKTHKAGKFCQWRGKSLCKAALKRSVLYKALEMNVTSLCRWGFGAAAAGRGNCSRRSSGGHREQQQHACRRESARDLHRTRVHRPARRAEQQRHAVQLHTEVCGTSCLSVCVITV